MSCPLCWHSSEAEVTTSLKFQLSDARAGNEGDPLCGTVNVQVCSNCGLSLFIMPNEPLHLIGNSTLTQ